MAGLLTYFHIRTPSRLLSRPANQAYCLFLSMIGLSEARFLSNSGKSVVLIRLLFCQSQLERNKKR